MIAIHDEDQLVMGERCAGQARQRCALDDTAVDGPGQDLGVDLPRRLDADSELDRWITLGEAGEPRGEVVACASRAGTDVQRTSLELPHRMRGFLQDLDRPKRGPAAHGERTPSVGEANTAAVTLQ